MLLMALTNARQYGVGNKCQMGGRGVRFTAYGRSSAGHGTAGQRRYGSVTASGQVGTVSVTVWSVGGVTVGTVSVGCHRVYAQSTAGTVTAIRVSGRSDGSVQSDSTGLGQAHGVRRRVRATVRSVGTVVGRFGRVSVSVRSRRSGRVQTMSCYGLELTVTVGGYGYGLVGTVSRSVSW